jgi:ADP-heptose:LPS heptosyltransferase
MKPRILICRTDRMGDVLLSLPAVLGARHLLGGAATIDFLVSDALAPLVAPLLEQQGVQVLSYAPEQAGWLEQLQQRSYSAAVSLFHDAALAKLLKRLAIPTRVGLYSKLESFFLYNAGKLQRRSRAEKSESVYAAELVDALIKHMGIGVESRSEAALPTKGLGTIDRFNRAFPNGAQLPVHPQALRSLKSKIELPGQYWVLHPGMGGSAENLSSQSYTYLAAAVSERLGLGSLLVTLGPGKSDSQFDALAAQIPGATAVRGLELLEFAELLRGATRVIAPSTGPLHLAHWVGASTLGLFSPVRSQHARRWAPFGGSGKSQVWWPSVDCPGSKRCVGVSCRQYFCLENEREALVKVLR